MAAENYKLSLDECIVFTFQHGKFSKDAFKVTSVLILPKYQSSFARLFVVYTQSVELPSSVEKS